MSWRAVARNALRPQLLGPMVRKATLRVREPRSVRQAGARRAAEWARSRERDISETLHMWDIAVATATEAFVAKLRQEAHSVLASRGMGGGGAAELLYFIVVQDRPRTVIETGVAAGWSTRAILQAGADAGVATRLLSSELPYIRNENPEQDIACLVPHELRQSSSWQLDIRGDRKALPDFVREVDHVDLLHFDSDKSVSGREFAYEALAPRLSERSVLVFDDIDDNMHFARLAEDLGRPFYVFALDGKYVGLIDRNESDRY